MKNFCLALFVLFTLALSAFVAWGSIVGYLSR